MSAVVWHYDFVRAGDWWACEYPERPHEESTMYHDPDDQPCPACVMAAEAALMAGAAVGGYLDAVGEFEERQEQPIIPGRPWP